MVISCTASDLMWDSPSSVQMNQASWILPPLSSGLHSFAKQLSVSLLCILLISSMFSGISLDCLHSAASEEGEIPSTVTANPPHLQLRSEEHTSELQSHLNLVCR